jgi:hypothetical protein
MATCPCCSNPLLRHIRNHQLTHFCRHCWQDMPVLEEQHYEVSLSSSLPGVYVQKYNRPALPLKLASDERSPREITPQTTSHQPPRTTSHRKNVHLHVVTPEQPISATH